MSSFYKRILKRRYPPRKQNRQNALFRLVRNALRNAPRNALRNATRNALRNAPRILPLLIFVIFKYYNKQNELHSNICLKVASAY